MLERGIHYTVDDSQLQAHFSATEAGAKKSGSALAGFRQRAVDAAGGMTEAEAALQSANEAYERTRVELLGVNTALSSARKAYRDMGVAQSQERQALVASIQSDEAKRAKLVALHAEVHEGTAAHQRLGHSIAALDAQLDQSRRALDAMGSAQARARAEAATHVAGLENERRQLAALGAQTLQSAKSIQTGSSNASEALFSVGRGFEDAAHAGGDLSLMARYAGNNVAQLAQQLGYVAAEAKQTGRTFMQTMVAALKGPAGMIAGITIAISLIPAFIKLLTRSGEAAKEAAQGLREQKVEVYGLIQAMREAQGVEALNRIDDTEEKIRGTEAQIDALRRLQRAYREAGDAGRTETRSNGAGQFTQTRVKGEVNISDDLRQALVFTGAMTDEQVEGLEATASTAEATREIARLQGRIAGLASQRTRMTSEVANTEERIANNLGVQLSRVRDRISIIKGNPNRDEDEYDMLVAREEQLQDAMRSRSQVAADNAQRLGGGGVTSGAADEAQQIADDAADLLGRIQDLGAVVVTAELEAATAILQHQNDIEQERLRQHRVFADDRVSLIEDEMDRARAAYAVDLRLGREEDRLDTDAVALAERAAREDATARFAQANREAGRLEDPGEASAARRAAQAQYDAAIVEAERDTALALEQIRTRTAERLIQIDERLNAAIIEGHRERIREEAKLAAAIEETRVDLASDLAQNAITDLASGQNQAEVDLLAGTIDEAEFRDRMDAVEEIARDRLKVVAQTIQATYRALANAAEGPDKERIKAELQAQIDLLQQLQGEVSDAGPNKIQDLAGDLARIFDDVADSIDALAGTLAALGVSEGTTALLGDVAGVVGNGANMAGNIASGNYVGAAMDGVKMVGSIAKLVTGINDRRAQEERAMKLVEHNTEQIRRNTDAMLEQGQVGEDVRAAQLEGLDVFFREAAKQLRGIGKGALGIGTKGESEALDSLRLLIRELESRGLDTSGFSDQIDDIQEIGDLDSRKAAYAELLEQIKRRFSGVAEAIGTYGDGIGGKLAEFEDMLEFLGLEGQAAFEAFLGLVGSTTDDLGALGAALASAGDIDVSTEEGRQELRDLVADLFDRMRDESMTESERDAFFGGLTPEEFERVLRELLDRAGGSGTASEDEGRFGDYADSVEGALRRFSDALQYLGLEGQDAVRAFFDSLRAQSEDMGDFADVLAEAEGLDVDSQAGQDRLRELVAAVFRGVEAGTFDTGGLSDEDVRSLLDELQGLGSSAGIENAGVRSVSQITAYQANEMLGYDQEQLSALRQIAGGQEHTNALLQSIAQQMGAPEVEAPVATVYAPAPEAPRPAPAFSLPSDINVHVDDPDMDRYERWAYRVSEVVLDEMMARKPRRRTLPR